MTWKPFFYDRIWNWLEPRDDDRVHLSPRHHETASLAILISKYDQHKINNEFIGSCTYRAAAAAPITAFYSEKWLTCSPRFSEITFIFSNVNKRQARKKAFPCGAEEEWSVKNLVTRVSLICRHKWGCHNVMHGNEKCEVDDPSSYFFVSEFFRSLHLRVSFFPSSVNSTKSPLDQLKSRMMKGKEMMLILNAKHYTTRQVG